MSRHKNKSVQSAIENSFKRGRNLYPNRSNCLGTELATFYKPRVINDVATTYSGRDLKKS